MMQGGATLIERLASIVGREHVLTDDRDVEPYLVDWRQRYRGAARAVVQPVNTAQVAEVVRACADTGTAIVPQGGNTGMCGGATPDASGEEIVISLARMRAIRALDADNATITVEAGMTLSAVQDAAREADLLFPLSLASEGSCTIGGNLATNAGGTAVLRYGNARELVLGLEVVLANGDIWNGLRGLRKDNTGYDLTQLFVGSEGTLGIITAAVLKLFAAPRVSVTAFCAVADVGHAVSLLRAMKQALGDRLTGFELISAFALRISRKHHPGSANPLHGYAWYALVQVDDTSTDPPLAGLVETVLAHAAESDISLPISAIAQFTADAEREIVRAFPGARVVAFGHLGDGNLHYNVAAPEGESGQAFLANTSAINRIVHDRVVAAGGSISAEHGIGQLKRAELAHYKSPIELELMRRVKSALDPKGLLNPGKVL